MRHSSEGSQPNPKPLNSTRKDGNRAKAPPKQRLVMLDSASCGIRIERAKAVPCLPPLNGGAPR